MFDCKSGLVAVNQSYNVVPCCKNKTVRKMMFANQGLVAVNQRVNACKSRLKVVDPILGLI